MAGPDVRLYLVDNNLPIILRDMEVKLAGGFVTGTEDGGEVAYPAWRVNKIEAIGPGGFWGTND